MSSSSCPIRSVVLLWKFNNFRSENLLMEKMFFKWPNTQLAFHLTLVSGNNTYEFSILKNDNSPFILSGTISAATDEKPECILCQFENYNFRKQYDSYKTCLNLEEFQYSNDSLTSNKSLTLRIHLWNPYRRDSIIPVYFAHTENKIEKCSFPWIIKRPIDLGRKVIVEVPRDFYFNDNLYNLILILDLVDVPNAEKNPLHFENRIEISLKNPWQTQFLGFIPLKCKIGMLTSEGNTLPVVDSRWDFLHFRDNVIHLPIKAELFSQVGTYSKGNLILHCHIRTKTNTITVLENVDYLSGTEKSLVQKNYSNTRGSTANETICTLKDCLYKLYREEKFCDVVLATREKKFPCHKNVLCCRSAVFSAMFENDTKEKESGLVNIVDADAKTLDLFLTALYTDEIGDLDWKSALAVYVLANKYDVTVIRKQCVEYFVSNLSSSNVSDVLELADIHQDEILKKHAEKFFFKHSKEVIKSSHWSNLMLKNIELAAHMMQKAFSLLD